MSAYLILLSTILAGQDKVAAAAKAPDKPAVDRSAEPALRSVFAAVSALHNVHFKIEYYNREPDAQRWDDDSAADLWIGDGGRFRLAHQYNYWGGGQTLVSDGESLMNDSMDQDTAIIIKKADSQKIHEANDQEPLLYLLEGDKGFDALVKKDKPVKFAESGDPSLKAIEINCSFGLVRFYFNSSNVPVRITTMLPPWYADGTADNVNPYPDQPYATEQISVVKLGHQDQTLFLVKAPTGRKVDDQRTAK